MNKKIRTCTIAAALTLIIFSTIGQTVHAQTSESFRFNNSAYVPGDTGTVTYYITNTAGQTISLKNLTFYFPWAGYDPSNKWQGNISINFSPWKTLVTNQAGGNVTYVNQVSFQVPTWFGATFGNHSCGMGASDTACLLAASSSEQTRATPTIAPISVSLSQPQCITPHQYRL